MFGYLRHFLVISLLVVITLAVLGGMTFRSRAGTELVMMQQENNRELSQAYIDTVWKRYRDVITTLSVNNAAQARNNPEVLQFAQDTLKYFQNMPLLRVNIYNTQGLLLMTVNPGLGRKLTPATGSPNSRFVAVYGDAQSTIVENTAMETGKGTIVQTIVPIRPGDVAVEGLIEIVSDVSEPWQQLLDFQLRGTGAAVGAYFLIALVLFLMALKTESIIAKQHEANSELAAAVTAAQAENRDKSQFLANVSHELRTPLNAIIGFSDIIKNEVIATVDNKKYHDYINDIHSSGVHLLSLINDILDFSKAEAGKLEIEVSEVNVTKMIQNCMRLVSPRAEAGNVKLVEMMPKEPIIMLIDGKKFKQIILNLLSNAVKFTRTDGEVRITAWGNLADDCYSFEVRDTGIGIAPKDISIAMSPFGQVDSTLSRKYEGTGLGLPLTKKFIELMGGKFGIKSEINVGTSITFSLPRELKAREGVIIKHIS